MTTKRRFTVRKMTSGYNGDVRYYVYDLQAKARVTVHSFLTRPGAQSEADELNISELVKSHAEDPRPYEVRLAEALAAFTAAKIPGKPLIERRI